MGETAKAKKRRIKEGWFEKYAPEDKSGIDIGCQNDPLNDKFRKWDFIYGDSDATFMKGIEQESYFTVYASHVLEHLDDPVTAVRNWFKILKKGGHLIICVPHRDLYEKKKELPSNWNFEHKSFWLPEKGDNKDTYGLKDIVIKSIPNANIVSFRILDEGHTIKEPSKHSDGEYAIEIIIKK